MTRFLLHCLCLVAVLSRNLANCTMTDEEEPRKTFRRSIDGSRGRKYYVPEEDDSFDNYGSSGRYDPYQDDTDLSDIRNNVPGEPGVDYPSYMRLPQTKFVCESHFRGYYADEEAGCQMFHVCDGNFLVSSFLCPIGSIFSQKFLTCDWWSKVDCSLTRNYHAINEESIVSEVDDDEISRKAFEMSSVSPVDERPTVETISQQRHQDQRSHQRVFNYVNTVTERINNLAIGQESYSDYSDYPNRLSSRYKSTVGKKNRQRYRDDDYYSRDIEKETQQRKTDNPSINIRTIGEDRKADRQGTFRNEFQSSYAPTSPTVTTKARRVYSPNVPTTYRPTTTRDTSRRFDLEFESSDHLYTARGRSDEIIKAATPPTLGTKHEVKLENRSSTNVINHLVGARRQIDKMEESESSDRKIHLPIDENQRNFTKVNNETIISLGVKEKAIEEDLHRLEEKISETLSKVDDNETIISLDVKEKAIKEDLDRLDEKISETLSILTIDNENRDPAVFSYNHDEETSTDETDPKFISVSSPVVNSSSTLLSDSNDDKKPVTFLQPPQEIQTQFRITVLNESPTGSNDKLSNLNGSVEKNVTEKIQTVEVPASPVTPPEFNDAKDIPESRIIHIFSNNSTNASSIEESQKLKVIVENVKSIDLSPEVILARDNFAETTIVPIEETSDTAKLIFTDIPIMNLSEISNVGEENSNERKIIPEKVVTTSAAPKIRGFVTTSATIESDVVTEKDFISKIEDSSDVTHEDLASKESIVMKQFTSNETIPTISPIENNDSKRSNTEEISLKEKNIDDAVELASSPFQVTLSINKNEEIDPNGDVIRKLLAQREIGDSIGAADYKSFEIVKSDERQLSRDNTENNYNHETKIMINNERREDNDRVNDETLKNYENKKVQSTDYLRNLVALVNAPNSPRPFSLEYPGNVDVKTSSNLDDESSIISTSLPSFSQTPKNLVIPESTGSPVRQQQSIVSSINERDSEKTMETLVALPSGLSREIPNDREVSEQLSGTFGEKVQRTNRQKLIFELPEIRRIVDFATGHPARTSEETSTRIDDEEHINERSNITEIEMDKNQVKTVVQTEFIPSLGFSLNTDEEREEYMEAVVKGLVPDVSATVASNNDTITSIES